MERTIARPALRRAPQVKMKASLLEHNKMREAKDQIALVTLRHVKQVSHKVSDARHITLDKEKREA